MTKTVDSSNNKFNKFLVLWGGECISVIGNGLSSFGLGIYVFNQTGKVSAMALITLLAFLPSLLLSTFAGVLADRYDRRLLMILSDSLSAVGLIYILICMVRGEATLWQICIGVTISSIFSSLLEPAYKATVTDLLTEDQYTKASGLVQMAGAAKFLISPVVAGFMLSIWDIKVLLIIDICTFLITVTTTFVVRKGLEAKELPKTKSFGVELKEGWQAIATQKGLLTLVLMGAVLTFLLGCIEVLAVPMILGFSTSKVAGTCESIVAIGMLVSSVGLGIIPIKKDYVKILSIALFLEGVFMIGFGLRENIVLIGVSGFLFFAMMPIANACLDFLVRTNLDSSVQGRGWAFIGLISQLGFVLAYSLTGLLADYVFNPLLLHDGALAHTVGKVIGTGNGRGTAFVIVLAGVAMCITSLVFSKLKSVKYLENRGDLCISS